jgi:formylglycine-generating enzyme
MNAPRRKDGQVTIIGELPRELGKLFESPRDMTMILRDAGLDPGMFHIHGLPAIIAWTYILAQQDQSRIHAVIDAAQKYYRDDEVLARAMHENSGGGLPLSERISPVHVEIIPADLSISAGASVFRYIPPGLAWVGADDGYQHERPRHQVRQSAFFLKDTVVTRAEFEEFCSATGFRTSAELGSAALGLSGGLWVPLAGANWRLPSGAILLHPLGGDHPVVQVSWYDASIYCRWFAQATGLAVGLPTETQWEYAAAGPSGLRWPFGDEYQPGALNAERPAQHLGTTPIRQFPPNAFGLYDMAGNVYQWCTDWYAPDWTQAGHALSSSAPCLDPAGPSGGSDKVLRGGSWFDTPHHCRCANRFHAAPILAAENWGFRPCIRLTDDLVRRLIAEPGWNLRAEDMLGGADHE